MRKLIETVQVSLGGEIGSIPEWVSPYLTEEHHAYVTHQLRDAGSLLLGRVTYEALSKAYPSMSGGDSETFTEFIGRMNNIRKYVASTTLRDTTWNARVIDGEVAEFIKGLKRQPGATIVKYGNGPLDVTLMEHGLIDEFHLLVSPVAVGKGQHLFEDIEGARPLQLFEGTQFTTGVVVLVYTPK